MKEKSKLPQTRRRGTKQMPKSKKNNRIIGRRTIKRRLEERWAI
jgi:hypothetical protein